MCLQSAVKAMFIAVAVAGYVHTMLFDQGAKQNSQREAGKMRCVALCDAASDQERKTVFVSEVRAQSQKVKTSQRIMCCMYECRRRAIDGRWLYRRSISNKKEGGRGSVGSGRVEWHAPVCGV